MGALYVLSLWLALSYGSPISRALTKTPVSSNVYSDIVYYAAFPHSAEQDCASPPHGTIREQYFENSDTDTQAALYRSDDRQEFVLAIPGTKSIQDWLTDVEFTHVPYDASGVSCPDCKVHHGFLDSWNSISPDVEAALSDGLAQYPDYAVTISGHSLGGAIGELAFGSLKPQSFNVKQVFTYGSPRVGNTDYATYIDNLTGATSDTATGVLYRVTHGDDGVPRLPGTFLGFSHPRGEYWEANDADGNPTQGSTFRCYGREARDCSFGQDESLTGGQHTSYAGLDFSC